MTSAARTENGHVRVKAERHGPMTFNIRDAFIGRSLDLYGEWSPKDVRLLSTYLHPGMTVLDIGANIGSHTLFFAGAAGPTRAVLAFKPAPGFPSCPAVLKTSRRHSARSLDRRLSHMAAEACGHQSGI